MAAVTDAHIVRLRTLATDPRWAPHVRRYVVSLSAVWRIYHGGLIVDVGEESPFSTVLREQHRSVQVTGDAELRVPAGPLPGCERQSASLVTCLEVIEHLKDPENDYRASWTGQGVKRVLRAIRETLTPDGQLLLSTPNVTGWISLVQMIRGRHPFMYAPHVREFAPDDVRALLTDSGFTVERVWTEPVWDRHGFQHAGALTRALLPLGFDLSHREDCIFVIARPRW